MEASQPVVAAAKARANQERQPDEQPRPSSSVLDSQPELAHSQQPHSPITGPSFLGLGSEFGPANSSYLFEDEEPRSHRGLWITLVLLVALALLGLRCRTELRQFRAELNQRAGPLYAAVLARVNPQPPAPPASSATTANPSPAEASPGTLVPEPPKDAMPANPPAGADTQSGKPSLEQLTPSNTAANGADEKPESAQPVKPDVEAIKGTSEKDVTETARRAPVAATRRGRRAQADKALSEDSELLRLSRKYIHGEGVRRDCGTGLAYLREAMKHPSPEAASQMGALYATGTCVARDRVAAYRYFTSALQMSPNNLWLAQERDKLYAQMSSAERRLADRQYR